MAGVARPPPADPHRHRPALRRRHGRRVLRRAGPARTRPPARRRQRHARAAGGGDARSPRADPHPRDARRGRRLRRHELHARRRPSSPRSWSCRWPTSRPGCAASTGACPRRSTGSSSTTCPGCCWPPTSRPRGTWRPRGSVPGARPHACSSWATSCRTSVPATVPAVRDEAAIRAAASEEVRALGLRTGQYVFATVHRAENRDAGRHPRLDRASSASSAGRSCWRSIPARVRRSTSTVRCSHGASMSCPHRATARRSRCSSTPRPW